MKKISLILFVLCIAFVSCKKTPEQEPLISYMELKFPTDWEVLTPTYAGTYRLVGISPKEGGYNDFQEYVEISNLKNELNRTMDDLLEVVVSDLENQLKIEELTTSKTKVNTYDAMLLKFKFKDMNYEYKVDYYIILENNIIYSMICTALAETYSDFGYIFNQIANSLEIID